MAPGAVGPRKRACTREPRTPRTIVATFRSPPFPPPSPGIYCDGKFGLDSLARLIFPDPGPETLVPARLSALPGFHGVNFI